MTRARTAALAAASLVLAIAVCAGAQTQGRMDALVSVLRPVLPFPQANATGDLPASGGASSKWFVLWPSTDDQRITVRANPLHPDTQAAGAEAMKSIQEAVIAAERRAQAEYDRALQEYRKTGKGTNIDGISLDDEGVAGERIDAELELTIDIDPAPASFDIGTSIAPEVTTSIAGPSFVIVIAANTYRDSASGSVRQRFRPAEARLVFGMAGTPAIRARGADQFGVAMPPAAGAFAVVLRGNTALLHDILSKADWLRIK